MINQDSSMYMGMHEDKKGKFEVIGGTQAIKILVDDEDERIGAEFNSISEK